MTETNFPQILRDRLSVAEVIGKVVKLTRKGREFSGLCPFHSEKTPSFTVSEEKGFYHCFGCGAHGDVITFVMKTQNLSFPEALEQLAAQAGIPIPAKMQRRNPAELQQNQKLLAVTAKAQEFFSRNLHAATGAEAKNYLLQRGLRAETLQQFALGWAGDARENLKQQMLTAGLAEADAVLAGMLIQAEQKSSYDRFRGRIMFPIFNGKQQPIAFGGRILGAGEPKYLNSPETPLFQKGRTLYALSQAVASIGKGKRQAIVVEGYMDAIALHQAGFTNAVANLGTALTEQQVQLLWRYGDQVLLCFDGDAAGQRASARAIERMLPILQSGKEIRFVAMPAGFDPDSLVLAKGPGALQAVLDQAMPFYAALAQMEIQAKPIDSPESRLDLSRRLQQRLRMMADADLREQYRQAMIPLVADIIRPPRPVSPPRRMKNYAKPYAAPAPAAIGKLRQADIYGREREALIIACIRHPVLLLEQAEALGTVQMERADLELLRLELLAMVADGAIDVNSDIPQKLSPAAQEIVQRFQTLVLQTQPWILGDTQTVTAQWQLLLHSMMHGQETTAQQTAAPILPPWEDEAAFQVWALQRQQENLARQDFEESLLEKK